MSIETRRRIPISPLRRNILELMRICHKVPLVTVERRMNLRPLVDARRGCPNRPGWTAMFIKAFAIVSARRPELRTAYVTYPYAHMYTHPCNHAVVVVEREYQGDMIPLNYRIRKPDRRSVEELHQVIEHYRTVPLENDETFRFLHLIGRMPMPIRRTLWNVAFHWSGSKRARFFGTFGFSSTAVAGAGLTTLVTPMTCTLHYGLLDDADRLEMRITFDHQAIDGAPIARALLEMEEVLLGEILSEVKQMSKARAAA